jgi:hypothetical protein
MNIETMPFNSTGFMQPTTRLVLCSLALLLGGSSGCSKSSTVQRAAIQGSVTLDGEPLKNGVIEFSPVTSKLGSGGKITNGRYQLPADKGLPEGEYLVRITSAGEAPPAQAVAPGMEPAPAGIAKERIAARFNAETTLKLSVPADASSLEQNYETSSK